MVPNYPKNYSLATPLPKRKSNLHGWMLLSIPINLCKWAMYKVPKMIYSNIVASQRVRRAETLRSHTIIYN